MSNPFVGCSKILTESDIIEVETRLGLVLPSDLRKHYLEANGGRPERQYYVTPDGDEYGVNSFSPMRWKLRPKQILFEEGIEDLVLQRKLIPPTLLPFADNGGGDLYCIHTETQEVFFYSMDHCEEVSEAATLIAPSLSAFIDGMVTAEEAGLA